jgi:hypothetical protein
MKRIEVPNKVKFISKKKYKLLQILRFRPGSVISHQLSPMGNCNEYALKEKVQYEKFDLQDWFCGKTEMEQLLTFGDDSQIGSQGKQNLENTFFYYDNEDKMNYDDVVESMQFILS